MRHAQKNQGMVPVTDLGARRLGLVTSGGGVSGTSTGRTLKGYTVLAADWVGGSAPYYADVTHNLHTKIYIVQLSDDISGRDIMPEDVDRTTDIDKCRVYLSYKPTSITVIIG